MADFDAQALAKLPREQLITLVVDNFQLATAEEAGKMRDDEIIHMFRMKFDTDYQKQVSAVSQSSSKKTSGKKAPVKKTEAVKSQPVKKVKVSKPANKDEQVQEEKKEETSSKSSTKAASKASAKVATKAATEASTEVKEVKAEEAKAEDVKSDEKTISTKTPSKRKTPAKKVTKDDVKEETLTKKASNVDVVPEVKNDAEANAAPETKAAPEAKVDAEAKANSGESTSKAKKPSKTKKASKTEEKPDVVDKDSKKEASASGETTGSEPSLEVATDKSSEKPSKAKRPSKKKEKTSSDAEVKEENKEASISEAPAIEATVVDAIATDTTATEVSEETKKESNPSNNKANRRQKNKNKKNNQTSESDETKAASSTGEEAQEQQEASEAARNNQKGNPLHKKPQRRTLSFGPGVNLKVEATAEVTTETQTEETPEQVAPSEPEIQLIPVAGVLSIGAEKNDYCGFLHATNYLPGEQDSYVPGQLIKRMGLRKGDFITGLATPARNNKGNPPLKQILTINGIDVSAEDFDWDIIRRRKKFENLTAIYPDEKLVLETGKDQYSTRIIDIICPIGKGQRGMVVSPPKAGKTVLLKKIANAITANDPKCKLIVLLIDERPEEVTDMQRSINGEVVYSTFDKKPENHVRVTELVLERAMRLVEMDEDVVILLDSMTRLARAYNLTITPTGRTLSGGLDPGSLYGPKRFFGAARNIENGGSLTIISTSLIETGSRMDEVIFEEFKGTGNMEVVLDRKLADRRVFPAIAVDKSGTRREDLLLSPEELDAVWKLRKRIADFDTVVATDLVIKLMERTSSNKVFVDTVIKKFDEADYNKN